MKRRTSSKALYLTPRILTIIFIIFLSLLALDVFAEYNFPEVLIALFMHLIPTFILIVITIIAWKWETIGGIIFIILGILYMILAGSRGHLLASLILAGPLFLIGILFILNKIKK